MDPIALSLAAKPDPRALGLAENPDPIALGLTAKKFKSCWV